MGAEHFLEGQCVSSLVDEEDKNRFDSGWGGGKLSKGPGFS